MNENHNIIGNQKSDSFVGIGQMPKPNVKIIDLQHNLLPFDSGVQGVAQMVTSTGATVGSGGAIASSTGHQIISDGGVRIDAQSLKNQLKQGKQEAVGSQLMS